MTKIDLIKSLPGIPVDEKIVQEILDAKIISYPYALRVCDYILDALGRPWWIGSGSLPATEILNRFDTVEFWADGQRFEGFLPVPPAMDYSINQGDVSMMWSVTIWFLNNNKKF